MTSSSVSEKIPQQMESRANSFKAKIPSKSDANNIAPSLKNKWDAHIDFLKKGQTAKALELICTAKRQDYAEMFKALGTNIGNIVSTQTGFELLSIDETVAKFNLTTNEAGTKYSYEVSFVRDFSGNWCILQY